MSKNYSICVGATGFGGGVWHSPDGGENWTRIRDPFPLGSQVRAMAVYPDDPSRILAGADNGIYRSEDKGASWGKLWSPMDGVPIWSIAIDPEDTETIFVGIKPAALFRSRDDGQSWTKLSVQMAQECHIGPPMVTMLMVDPKDHRTVWAGVEVDGSTAAWTAAIPGPTLKAACIPDIHGMAISPGEPNRVIASTPREIYATTDMGESWESVVTTDQFVLPYSRGIAVKPGDPNVIFSGVGDTAIGGAGAIQRSRTRAKPGKRARCRLSPTPTSGNSPPIRRTQISSWRPASWESCTRPATPETRGSR
ncbi:Xyloglucanase [Geodia barretti]|uniref:Xyloglucanase n=1 Tax=Geodia barretti TaxID=519541 RepID=A0AA35TP20_GEOBA|nr:Xyloglucanase [Geodia barretti]